MEGLMRKLFVVFEFVFVCGVGLAQEKTGIGFDFLGNRYGVWLGSGLRLSVMNMEENVFSGENSDDVISGIEWKMGTGFGIESKLKLCPDDLYKKLGFFAEADGRFFFPSGKGQVIDSDYNDKGQKYSEGIGIGVLNGAQEAEVSLGAMYPFSFGNVDLAVRLGIGFFYQRKVVYNHDGEIRQVNEIFELRDDDEKFKIYGTSISYVQEWLALKPSLGVAGRVSFVNFDMDMAFSPLVKGSHVDNHYMRQFDDEFGQKYIIYEDETKGKLYSDLKGEVFLKINGNIETGMGLFFRQITGSRGDTVFKTAGLIGYIFNEEGTSGAFVRDLGLRLFLRVKI
jgi:outer membrane protease